jgi:hypothetical protein
MRRIVAVVGLSTLIVSLNAGAAWANAPSKTRGAFEFDVDFSGLCSFDVLAHARGDTQLIVFVDGSGTPTRAISTGQFFVTLTNVDSGFSRTFAIPGPSFFDATGTLVHGTGTWLTITANGAFVLAAGNMDLAPDSTLLSIRGRTFDVCSLLG